MGDILRFKLKRKEVLVVLETDDGDQTYYLRDMTGRDRDTYLRSIGGKIKFDEKGKPAGFTSLDGLQLALLELTLFDDKNKPVKREVLQDWPAELLEQLFNKSQELSALTAKSADAAGNG